MNASETIARNKAKAIYVNLKQIFATNNPGGDCLTSTCNSFSSCNVYFNSYDLKYNFEEGRDLCNNCTCSNGSST